MSTPIQIKDGGGTARKAIVTPAQGLLVAQTVPPVSEAGVASRQRLFAQYLGSTGQLQEATSDGNADQGVAGNVTPKEFFIEASQDFDIRVMSIGILIADSAVAHNNFGNVNALTNGWDLSITEAGEETFIIKSAKTGGQIIAQAGFSNPYGDGVTSFELSNWNTNEDAQTISVPLGRIVPNGLRLARGSNDRITATVRDDLTGLTEMYVRVFGYRHYP